MHLKEIKINGFKSFGNEVKLEFPNQVIGIVGPNGSGKSNVTEAFRFVLGEQSMKTLRGRRGEDLIFNGGVGATRSSKATVEIILDDKQNKLTEFDNLSLKRVVLRDGTNEYYINGSQVRHRDVVELLARVNIGATGHHIISQGEADRILSADPVEKKEMIEDGLGLKLLQYKKTEAEKKLKKTRNNIEEVSLLQRELTPHLRYLERQCEKFEKAKNIRIEIVELYAEYLKRETKYISETKKISLVKNDSLNTKIEELDTKIENEEKVDATDEINEKMISIRNQLNDISNQKNKHTHELGKLEGEINVSFKEDDIPINKSDIEEIYNEGVNSKEDSATILATILNRLKLVLQTRVDDSRKNELISLIAELKNKISVLETQEKVLVSEQGKLQEEQDEIIKNAKDSEKGLLGLIKQKNEYERELLEIKHTLDTLSEDSENVQRELDEGLILIGHDINKYESYVLASEDEDRHKQKERRRILERKKIELESLGTGENEETLKEYNELKGRIEFLDKEKADLFSSIDDCEETIARLQVEIDKTFKDGIEKITKEFDTFFKILFGGGKASVEIERKKIEREDEEPEIRVGVVVKVSLPQKKVASLDQLSGGERALVSIALLFAISQTTPPPFLILDETDAALDEANSVRYGDMIEELSKKSQLILVTHNRETMMRSNKLYGVTMNASGISILLSVSFEEASEVAK